MRTHFVKLRRLLILISVLSPVLFFVAFLCYAGGLIAWSLAPAGLAMVFLCVYPHQLVDAPISSETESKLGRWISLVVMVMFVTWLTSLPEFLAFMDRIDSHEVLWDGRLVLAIFVWLSHWGYSSYRKVAGLKDPEILAYYDDEPSPEIHQAEQDVDPNA